MTFLKRVYFTEALFYSGHAGIFLGNIQLGCKCKKIKCMGGGGGGGGGASHHSSEV